MSRFELREGQDRRKLLIAFEVVRQSTGDQVFAQLVDHTNYSVLLVDSLNHELKNKSINDLFDTFPNTIRQIKEYIHEIEPLSLGVIGSSFSGWLALHCGSLLNADVAVAFSPETVIGGSGSRSASYLKGSALRFEHPDIRETFLTREPTTTHIYVGEDDATDIEAAYRLHDLPSVHIHSLQNVGHNVFRGLARTGFLRSMFGNMLDQEFKFDDFYGRGQVLDSPELTKSLVVGREHFRNKRWHDAARDLCQAFEYFPTNLSLRYELGISYFRIGQYEDSVRVLKDLVTRESCPRKAIAAYTTASEKLKSSCFSKDS